METEFTPLTSLLGGVLIGLSAVIYMVAQGRIAGISGIIARLLPPNIDKSSISLGVVFVIGLLLAAPIWQFMNGEPPIQNMTSNTVLLAIAGLLVGFGTVLGSGCTSGHGVCGISRLSTRSLIATLTFMATGFITVFILRHIVGA